MIRHFQIIIKLLRKNEFERSVDYTDHNRRFKDLITGFVVTEFYNTDADLANFIQLVVDVFETMIDEYILYNEEYNLKNDDILFLYKGGNVLRILAFEAMSSQPGIIKDILFKQYSDFLKDLMLILQFILININEDIFKKIYNELSILTFINLKFIRSIFFDNLTEHFNYARLNNEVKQKILKQYLEKLNNSNSLKDPNNKYFNGYFTSLQLGTVS